jgi:hypothetical protein
VRKIVFAVIAMFGTLCVMNAWGQIEVGAGATLDLGSGSLDAGCQDLSVAGNLLVVQGSVSGVRSLSIIAGGQLGGGAGTISWSGDWTNNGMFDAGTSTASSVDGCGRAMSTFTTGDTFSRLSLQSGVGREIRFPSGRTTMVQRSFVAAGLAANRLLIRSTTAGSAATTALGPAATQSVFAVDVADNHGAPEAIAPGPASSYQSVKGPNSEGWFDLASAAGIPALSVTGLALLAAALAVAALLRFANGSA